MGDARMPVPATALDHESTIVAVVELTACLSADRPAVPT
jgi:hypothetical protein